MNKIHKVFIVLGMAMSLFWSEVQAQLKCELTNDPAKIQLFDDDVKNFLTAMDILRSEKDWAAVIQREYLDKASPGLKEYLREKGYKAEKFVEAIRERKASYDSLKDLPEQLELQEGKIREAFAGLVKVIPQAVFMPVYYLVGPNPGALGEPSEYGLMIAISELDRDIEDIHLLLVHETIHVQQALTIGMEEYQAIFGPKLSLLALAIREGAAYYLTLLSTDGHTHKESYDYYVQNEKNIWERFRSEMNGKSPGDWMWETPANPEQPPHLGYIIGARIAEAYYKKAADKAKAVQDILSVTNYSEFLQKSGYAEKFQ